MNRQGIEGVPDHLKAVEFRHVQPKERYLDDYGVVHWTCSAPTTCQYLIVQPDNVYGVYELSDVDFKNKTKYETGEFRVPSQNEWYVPVKGYKLTDQPCTYWAGDLYANSCEDKRRIIVKPIAKKTRRFVIAEQELYVDAVVQAVEARFEGATFTVPLKFRIEEREIETNGWMD